ncbi:ankyrin [Xylaria bambusicola]|uniref:ankyrin n=1 Tax=Xylaria bambusicola TaxID=326684 RepID=UPI002008B8C5|nr:ankyrin [Xylaria bambusicola]KAI0517624.1 ankyrin [Xylaria bambusicola]
MHLFKLPPELVQPIFEQIVKSRQFEHVMRIRIVSRQFKTYIDDAIFRLRLLSQLAGCLLPTEKFFRCRPAFVSYMCSYLEYQTVREKSTTSRLGRIHRAAKAVCEIEGHIGGEIVMKCTILLILLAMHDSIEKLLQEPKVEEPCSDGDLEADLYVAAIYLGQKPYIKGLIADGVQFCSRVNQPDIRSTVFGTAFHAATLQGSLDMIELLISCVPKYRDTGSLPYSQQREIFRYAWHPRCQDAVNFALDKRPINLTERGVEGLMDAMMLEKLICRMPVPQCYERVAALLEPSSLAFGPNRRNYDPTGWLIHWAALGEINMVYYMLAKGANPNQTREGWNSAPLLSATRSANEEIVRILLEAGADSNTPQLPNSPLMEAVWKGNIDIVKLLLSYGADVQRGCPPPIVLAVSKERMDLFRLLRERGARLDTPGTGGWAMAIAQKHGLSSMVDVLLHEGVTHDAVLQYIPNSGERWWHRTLWPLDSRPPAYYA